MYFYTYRIQFVDGCYYYGRRKCACPPSEDIYFGSPKTNADKWKTTMYQKIILDTYQTLAESDAAEHELIGDNYKTDPLCLNEHNRDNFINRGHTAEARAKMSASHLGKKKGAMSEEHKANLSAAKKGKKFSKEHKEKLSAAHRGQCRPHTEETKAKIGAKHKGSKRSEESRRKMSEAKKEYYRKLRETKHNS